MPQYFDNFSKITYGDKILTNILSRVDFFNVIKQNTSLYEYANIQDGFTPEQMADVLYGDPNLFWILLWINDIADPYFGWPMTDSQLTIYISEKYGEENIYAVHHYETTDSSDLGAGVWVNEGTAFSQEISNYTYENSLNDAKRKIRILKQGYITQVLTELKKAMQ